MRLRRSKFGNIKTKIDGYIFDSKAEARRYQELKILLKKNEIKGLEVHPKFPLKVNDRLVCNYEADFSYRRLIRDYSVSFQQWENVIEDVKGVRTAIYRLKKKLFEAIFWDGPKITEVKVK